MKSPIHNRKSHLAPLSRVTRRQIQINVFFREQVVDSSCSGAPTGRLWTRRPQVGLIDSIDSDTPLDLSSSSLSVPLPCLVLASREAPPHPYKRKLLHAERFLVFVVPVLLHGEGEVKQLIGHPQVWVSPNPVWSQSAG